MPVLIRLYNGPEQDGEDDIVKMSPGETLSTVINMSALPYMSDGFIKTSICY